MVFYDLAENGWGECGSDKLSTVGWATKCTKITKVSSLNYFVLYVAKEKKNGSCCGLAM
jgi:hypothetical protein